MKKVFRFAMMFMAAAILTTTMTACGDDDEPAQNTNNTNNNNNVVTKTEEQIRDSILSVVNKEYVAKTVIATYSKLATDCAKLQQLAYALNSQSALEQLCNQWKVARQDWELSESFLFGAASGYGIDPHIDTWPFDVTSFNNVMSKFSPATNEEDAATIEHMVATTQNFTGFHAMEYVIFREGQPRTFTALTADEIFFVKAVADDLLLSACRLEVAWAGSDAPAAHISLLEDAEMEPEDTFGAEFITAGQSGSRWASVLDASTQIIDGCIDIIGEVADSKIAAAYTGDDESYIESPHAYNSVQDFYDNIRGCKQALYGGLTTIDATTPAQNSVMGYCLTKYAAEARTAMTALDNALTTINQMKRPFVLNYKDASAGKAIDALHTLDDALSALKTKLDPSAE